MRHVDRLHLVEAAVESEILPILKSKGQDYSGHAVDDANANFKTAAHRLLARGLDKYDVWAVYCSKHLQSVETFLSSRGKDGKPTQLESEPIHARIVDIITYHLILWSMLVEDGIAKDPRDSR